METRTCEKCDKDITFLHGHCKFCEECAKKSKKEYDKKYNKRYDKQFPKSARGRYREYYKFLMTLTQDDLSALYSSKQHKLNEAGIDKRKVKAQIVLINEAYKRKGGE